MFRAVVRPATDVRLDHVASVQKGHLPIGAHPYLPARVLGEDGQGGDVELELARLGELAFLPS